MAYLMCSFFWQNDGKQHRELDTGGHLWCSAETVSTRYQAKPNKSLAGCSASWESQRRDSMICTSVCNRVGPDRGPVQFRLIRVRIWYLTGRRWSAPNRLFLVNGLISRTDTFQLLSCFWWSSTEKKFVTAPEKLNSCRRGRNVPMCESRWHNYEANTNVLSYFRANIQRFQSLTQV